jgi:hypothetical protein
MYMNISDHRVLKEILEQQMYLEQENGLAEMAKGHLRELERNALLDIEFILHQLCRAGAPEVINSRTFRS